VLKNDCGSGRRLVVSTLSGLLGFGIVCVAMEPFDVLWLYGAALGSAAAGAYVLAGGRSVGEAALAAAAGSLLVVVAVLVYVIADADGLSLVELAFVLTHVVWWIVGVAIVVLLAPALVCSMLLVAATRGVLNRAWHG
jgi:hypothetical protein